MYEFATATKIIFGPDSLNTIASIVHGIGKRAFVVTGSSADRAKQLLVKLEYANINYTLYHVSGEPTIDIVTAGIKQAREYNADLIIGIGGGSVIDTGKAIAALLTNHGSLIDYLEVIGKGKSISRNAAPYIAIPTTAGTGSEVTRNAVIGSPEHRVKVSMRDPKMIPRIAIIDPILTTTMPMDVTASSGMDALSHLIEAFVSTKANPLTDGFCRDGLTRIGRSFKKLFKDETDINAREDMHLASLFGGFALANAKLGAVHGFAGPLGGLFSISHGAICARLLPFVMEANVLALQSRDQYSDSLNRYDEIAGILTGKSSAKATAGIIWVKDLCEALNIPKLSKFGFDQSDYPTLIDKAKDSSSMKGNPILLDDLELAKILNDAAY